MKNRLLLPVLLAALSGVTLDAPAQDATAMVNASILLKADQPGPVINRHIYGQFAEHLGHGIYGGL